MSEKKKPVGMAFDISTRKSYKVYAPQTETINLTFTREQAQMLMRCVLNGSGYLESEATMAEIKNQIEEKLK